MDKPACRQAGLLKSPNSPHIVCFALIVVVLGTIGEAMEPRDPDIVFGGTPTVANSKTANDAFFQV